jgi:hypothetical protein
MVWNNTTTGTEPIATTSGGMTMTTATTAATTALRDVADTIRDAAETGIQSIGGLLEDAKSRVDSVQIPKVNISKRRKGRGWMGWALVAGAVAVVAVLKSRSKSKHSTTTAAQGQREPAAA